MERKHAYTCGKYRLRTGDLCTTHDILKSVIKELVLTDIPRILPYVKGHEQLFIEEATEYGSLNAAKALRQKRTELNKAKPRMGEVDILFGKMKKLPNKSQLMFGSFFIFLQLVFVS